MKIVCTQNKGVHITTDIGLTISIQWGHYNYGTNRNAPSEELCIPAGNVEMAFFFGTEPLLDLPNGDQVIGYVQTEKALSLALILGTMNTREGAIAIIENFVRSLNK